MLGSVAAEIVALVLLAAVLTFAMAQPRGLPEALVAVPAAGLTVVLGLVAPSEAVRKVAELGPTVGFLAAILVLAHLADSAGVFRWLGWRLAAASAGRPVRLLGLVFVAASVTTAALSLDATVVLLTPVVFGTAARLRLRPKPHVYACTHLANSASTLLPVSNLTNLLAFSASGLSFTAFGALMALPWLAAIGVEYLVFRRFFGADLAGRAEPQSAEAEAAPRFALTVLAVTLAGFGASGAIGVDPAWVAVAGAVVLAVPALVSRRVRVTELVSSASPLFCLFVLALGVVVAGVTSHGLGDTLAALIPAAPSLLGLLAVAALAAALANLVNNLPATLALLGALGPGTHPGLVLAVLLGVNIGPNLTYVGSLATLLWRRVLAGLSGSDSSPSPREFVLLGLLTVPACLVAAVLALWFGLTVGRGWLV
ncbi:ArsB/NhaD family transporter [Pseudonocardia spinosispora]|uniref:ArsB/NhaD family transporter n=1 Tax=Pseudonocardia spinosispora TaxID=103441 RepID=UPI001B7F9402|nr:ArsB/NhaD family transporter [Pseudonocardia spinosispora]